MMRAAMRESKGARRRATLAVLLVGGLSSLTGCATKKDVRTLQAELMAMQARQDSAMMSLQRQNRQLLDSLRTSMAITQDVRGQTSHRFQQLEQTLEQTQDLVGQVMQSMQALMTRLDQVSAAGPAAPAPTGVSSGGNAQEYYDAGMEKMADAAYGTARRAFEQLLREFRTSELAPAAQYQIGESYAAEKEYERAVTELEKVAAEWPAVKEAPQALYRAGVISADNLKQRTKARELLNRVVNGYASSPEAALARTKLRSLPR